ncbi:MAG: DUF2183 domain-containing protein [Methylotenera sp.]|nr:DUF2183 domain-containing protein [Oligoflexia bacterium]
MKFDLLPGLFLILALSSQVGVAAEPTILISDIDDTAKITHVRDSTDATRNGLFGHDFFAGMADLYRAMPVSRTLYLSGSPTLLRSKLAGDLFGGAGFPPGDLILRGKFVFEDIYAFKSRNLRDLAKNLQGKFILVGDDTESDADVFCDFAKDFPDRVAAVYIHRLMGDREPRGCELQYFLPIEIAVAEAKAGRLNSQGVKAAAQGLLKVTDMHFWFPAFAACPRNYRLPSNQGPLRQILGKIETQASNYCTNR